MQYRSGADTSDFRRTTKDLVIGSTLAWRPTQNARFDRAAYRLRRSRSGARFLLCSLFFRAHDAGKSFGRNEDTISSVAIIVSLIFVGLQIKQNTGALQRNEHNPTMAHGR